VRGRRGLNACSDEQQSIHRLRLDSRLTEQLTHLPNVAADRGGKSDNGVVLNLRTKKQNIAGGTASNSGIEEHK
jgi:hypothetical protein